MNPRRDWHSEYERSGFSQANEKVEIGQPDPTLQEEPASAGRIAVYAVGAMIILGIVLYGLNRPAHENVTAQQGPSSTTAPTTTGAAPQEKPEGNAQPEKAQ